ncbi:DNA polymerase epsilon subunit 4 [Pararge aegeria]|uniref:Jg20765 protein n=2 Tax=Pararge aegeria TaxID=116150 RepID=A0A8S4R5Z7_9NEOP|nr:DNA polymerase epsilon subunit 4 [Pararge aegeria]CAH2229152.1 jg20765 [Pararge aegeria aegeria]
MSEEENYTELDISDVVEDTDHYLETDYQRTDIIESELSAVQDSEILNSEDQVAERKLVIQGANKPEVLRTTKLPLARIKNIMKLDPDVSVVNAEAVFLVTKATELFLETIAKETYTYTAQQKRKTIAKKDLDVVINKVDCLCFLEGAMDF